MIDGSAEAVWNADEPRWIGLDIFAISFRALHDGRTLYLFVHNHTDEQFQPDSGVDLWFDDQGGPPPRLWDGGWNEAACDAAPKSARTACAP